METRNDARRRSVTHASSSRRATCDALRGPAHCFSSAPWVSRPRRTLGRRPGSRLGSRLGRTPYSSRRSKNGRTLVERSLKPGRASRFTTLRIPAPRKWIR